MMVNKPGLHSLYQGIPYVSTIFWNESVKLLVSNNEGGF